MQPRSMFIMHLKLYIYIYLFVYFALREDVRKMEDTHFHGRITSSQVTNMVLFRVRHLLGKKENTLMES